MNLAPLRRREYRLLFIAQSISWLGTMVTYVALPYQVYALTASSWLVGLLGLAELVPLLAAAFLGGALADAVDRRRLALATDVGLAAGSLALALLAATPQPPTISLFVVAGWMSAMSALQRPSLESLAQRQVPPDEMAAASALGTLRGSVAMIAGPALGGALIASAGLTAAYLADVASYACSLVCIARLASSPPDDEAAELSVGRIVEGLRYARERQELVGTYVVDFVAMVFGMPIALFPALSQQLGGPAILGWLYAAPAIGAGLVSVTSSWTGRVSRHGRAVLMAATVWGLAIVALGLSTGATMALTCLVVAGAADAVSGIFRMTLWNQTIPNALRGRLASIEMVSYSSGPLLGNVEAGLVAAASSVSTSIVSGGVLCVAGVALCALTLPEFVAYDARTRLASAATNDGPASSG